jgi:hypothetical protein
MDLNRKRHFYPPNFSNPRQYLSFFYFSNLQKNKPVFSLSPSAISPHHCAAVNPLPTSPFTAFATVSIFVSKARLLFFRHCRRFQNLGLRS